MCCWCIESGFHGVIQLQVGQHKRNSAMRSLQRMLGSLKSKAAHVVTSWRAGATLKAQHSASAFRTMKQVFSGFIRSELANSFSNFVSNHLKACQSAQMKDMRLKTMKKELDDKVSLTASREQAKHFQSEMKSLQSLERAMKQELAEAEKRDNLLSQQGTDAQNLVKQLQGEVKCAEQDNQKLSSELDQAQSKLNTLSAENKKLHSKYTAQLEKQKATKAQTDAQVAKLQTEIEGHKNAIKAMEGDYQKISSELQEHQQKLSNVTAEHARQRADSATQREAIQAENDTAKTKLSKMESNLKAAQQATEELENIKQENSDLKSAHETEKNELLASIESLKAKLQESSNTGEEDAT